MPPLVRVHGIPSNACGRLLRGRLSYCRKDLRCHICRRRQGVYGARSVSDRWQRVAVPPIRPIDARRPPRRSGASGGLRFVWPVPALTNRAPAVLRASLLQLSPRANRAVEDRPATGSHLRPRQVVCDRFFVTWEHLAHLAAGIQRERLGFPSEHVGVVERDDHRVSVAVRDGPRDVGSDLFASCVAGVLRDVRVGDGHRHLPGDPHRVPTAVTLSACGSDPFTRHHSHRSTGEVLVHSEGQSNGLRLALLMHAFTASTTLSLPVRRSRAAGFQREFTFQNRIAMPEISRVSESHLGYIAATDFLSVLTDDDDNDVDSLLRKMCAFPGRG